MARCPKVYHPNLCRIQVKDSKEPQFYNSAGNDSEPSCSNSSFVQLQKYFNHIWKYFKEKDQCYLSWQNISDILHNILDKFIKKSVMEEVTSMAKLAKVDVMKKKTYLMQRMLMLNLQLRNL